MAAHLDNRPRQAEKLDAPTTIRRHQGAALRLATDTSTKDARWRAWNSASASITITAEQYGVYQKDFTSLKRHWTDHKSPRLLADQEVSKLLESRGAAADKIGVFLREADR